MSRQIHTHNSLQYSFYSFTLGVFVKTCFNRTDQELLHVLLPFLFSDLMPKYHLSTTCRL